MSEVNLTLTLKVKYESNGLSKTTLKEFLSDMVEKAVGDGMLTNYSEAEVEKYSFTIK